MLKKMHRALKREGRHIFAYTYERLKIKKYLKNIAFCPISLPVALLILAIRPWIKVRMFLLYSNRIGHYAWNTEFWLNALENAANKDKKIKNVFYTIPGNPICNTQLHKMWKRVIRILPFPTIMAEVDQLLSFLSQSYRDDEFKRFFKPGGGSWDAWDLVGKSNKPHISFTPEEKKKGELLLKRLGIPLDAKYICILGRDANYIKNHLPKENTEQDAYRDVNINHYKNAALYLAENGFYVIRMGKYVKDPFAVNHPHVIDYAKSSLSSDFADIYLSANCYFFISVATGLDSVPYIFKRPILQTNVPGFDGYLWPSWTFFITKKVFDHNASRLLTFSEIADIFSYDKTNKGRLMAKIIKEKNLEFIENSPEELESATQEMLQRLLGKEVYSAEDQDLQKQFWNCFVDSRVASLGVVPPKLTLPMLKNPVFEGKNLEYNKTITKIDLRMSTDFLRKNKDWLIAKKPAESQIKIMENV